jgi:hypothetical protein
MPCEVPRGSIQAPSLRGSTPPHAIALAAIGAGAALAAFSIAGNINTIWEEANAIIAITGS